MDVMPRKKKSSSIKGESLFTVHRFNQLKAALMPLFGPGLLFAAIFCALALLTYDVAETEMGKAAVAEVEAQAETPTRRAARPRRARPRSRCSRCSRPLCRPCRWR